MLNPPVNLLSPEEIEPVVAVLREAADLGAADRALRQQISDRARRLAALRQAQNLIFSKWEKSPARKRREALVQGHRPEKQRGNRS